MPGRSGRGDLEPVVSPECDRADDPARRDRVEHARRAVCGAAAAGAGGVRAGDCRRAGAAAEGVTPSDFEALVEPLLDAALRIALRIAATPADAEDAVQTAVAYCLAHLDRPMTGAYVLQVVTHRALNGRRDQ